MRIHNQQYDRERIMRLHRQGLSIATIARRMGLSPTTVGDVIRKGGPQRQGASR